MEPRRPLQTIFLNIQTGMATTRVNQSAGHKVTENHTDSVLEAEKGIQHKSKKHVSLRRTENLCCSHVLIQSFSFTSPMFDTIAHVFVRCPHLNSPVESFAFFLVISREFLWIM